MSKRSQIGRYKENPERNKASVKSRRVSFKLKAIEYKGGSCIICGYDKCPQAMDFHHLDPSQKDFNLNQRELGKAWDTIRSELDKCVLLCANCHREVHADIVSGAVSRI